MRNLISALAVVVLTMAPMAAGAAQIEGDYIEARTADVYTGPCFSNAEVFITGHQAVLAWVIREGTWEGSDLSGLAVAAAVRGSTTFSEDNPGAAQAVLIVDEAADARQRAALVSLAQHLGGDRLTQVVDIKTARMDLTIEHDHATMADPDANCIHHMPQAPSARFTAAGLAEIATRPLDDGDHHCGNEVVAYEPLSKGVDVLPAYTLAHAYRGNGLDTTWNDPHCRSAFIGHFAY